MIPYGKQDINEEDINQVIDILKSDWLTQGPKVPEFENSITTYTGGRHAVAVTNGTSALHMACLALGLTKGDVLWTSPTTFVASANCALYCGAKVDFVDIDEKTYNISIQALEKKLEDAKRERCLPKIIIPVHMCGQPCDMKAIYELSKKYGFKIIEDASHAIGAEFKGQKIGNCKYSDITTFSFHPVKIITSGEGGMALTNSKEVYEKMLLIRSHGITSEPIEMQSRPDDEIWNYQQISLGYNFRMTDIQAALGCHQMRRIDSFISQRRKIAKKYDVELSGLSCVIPFQNNDSLSSYHIYPIRIKPQENQKKVYQLLRKENIAVNIHYIPVYRQPYYEKLGFKIGYCPNAESFFKETITLPIYPSLSNEQQNFVIKTLEKLLS
jgi:UDP-4-amino-4,6-dideoxy-N-acetyl-beta-L-altrosamine transaminase